MKKIAKLKSFIPFFDIFGHEVDFYINSQTKVKSILGGIFSILIIFLCLYTFINNYVSWTKGEDLTTISAYRSYNGDNCHR